MINVDLLKIIFTVFDIVQWFFSTEVNFCVKTHGLMQQISSTTKKTDGSMHHVYLSFSWKLNCGYQIQMCPPVHQIIPHSLTQYFPLKHPSEQLPRRKFPQNSQQKLHSLTKPKKGIGGRLS